MMGSIPGQAGSGSRATSAGPDHHASPPAFRDRAAAGAKLGARLLEASGAVFSHYAERSVDSAAPPSDAPGPDAPGRVVLALEHCVVLALPRGGVPVAVEVARALRAPLGVVLVRKIGHPQAPEYGLGAIAEDGYGGVEGPFFDDEALARSRLRREDLADVVARERAELARRAEAYGRAGPDGGLPDLAGQCAVVVDDGLATGVTARAALRAVRARGAARTVLAVPVAAPASVRAMEGEADTVVALVVPRRFSSVGQWYLDFDQLADADVLALLSRDGEGGPPGS
jgi:predicted phosphoribosyltransferase